MKILSVIVPTYNMEKYLDKCLTSLIVPDADLMDKLEVLVVNDGSKDRSSEIAHSYEKRYPNTFCIIDKQNGNYGSCINAALPIATGKYVKVLDADDWFETDNFSEFLLFLENCKSDLVLSRTQTINERTSVVNEVFFINNLAPGKVYSFGEIPSHVWTSILMHSVTYANKIFEELDYFQVEGISYTDNQWMFEPMVNVFSVQLYDKIIYNYLVGREGQTIDFQILSKRRIHQLILAKALLDKYYHLETDLPHREYLSLRISDFFYWVYFITRLIEANDELTKFEQDIFSVYPSSRDLARSFENEEYFVLRNKWKNFNFWVILKSVLSIGVVRSWREIRTANWYGVIPSYRIIKLIDRLYVRFNNHNR